MSLNLMRIRNGWTMKRYKTLTMLMAAILNSALAFAAPIRCVTSGMVETVAFSPDGKTVASGGMERVVHIWDAKDGSNYMSCRYTTPKKRCTRNVDSSPDSKSLAIGRRGREKPITFWIPLLERNLSGQFQWTRLLGELRSRPMGPS